MCDNGGIAFITEAHLDGDPFSLEILRVISKDPHVTYHFVATDSGPFEVEFSLLPE